MSKESKKSRKDDKYEEVISVTIDGTEYLSFPIGKVKDNVNKLVDKVRTANFCNENPSMPVEEAMSRFTKLDESRRRTYGIRPYDSIETFVRILDDVCGKEFFPPLGKHVLQSHFTVKDFITGAIDALTFAETFTNGVAKHMEMKMSSELTKVTPLYRDENSCLLYTSPSPRDRQKSRMPSSA